MAKWASGEFDEAAGGIARAFLAGQGNGGASLNDLTTKCARDNALNPEQINRLCRLVNVMTFETKSAEMKGDKYVQFSVADGDVVCGQLQDAASTKQASFDAYPELEDRMGSLRETDEPEGMKIASAMEAAKVICRATRGPADIDVYLSAKSAAERHRSDAGRDEVAWAEALRKVVEKTAGMRWDHDAFEKSALSLTEGDCLEELNAIREALGRPPLDLQLDKMAELLDRLEAAPTAEAHLVKRATAARKSCAVNLNKMAAAEAVRDGVKGRGAK